MIRNALHSVRQVLKKLRPSAIPGSFGLLAALLVVTSSSHAQPEAPLLDLESVNWIHGEKDCEAARKDPGYVEWQQVRYQANTYIFRQNKCSNYEGPFVYLLIGTDRSLVIDTGATVEGGASLLNVIRNITDTPLVVAHSHGHGDHTKGDSAFAAAKNAVVVGTGAEAVQEFFGFRHWPGEPAHLELGNRNIEILPIPGHRGDDLAYYDPVSQFAITGDTLYPGRLYVSGSEWEDFRASIARLNDWIKDKPVSYVMGTHIEMTAEPNIDYPVGTTYQPNEIPLPLSTSDIVKLNEALMSLDEPERTYLRNFIIWPR